MALQQEKCSNCSMATIPNTTLDDLRSNADDASSMQTGSCCLPTGRNFVRSLSLDSAVPIKSCPCVNVPSDSGKCSQDCIRLGMFENPDNVKWHIQTEAVVVTKNKKNKAGFDIKVIPSKKTLEENYIFVRKVESGGPADGKLTTGDNLLSANGNVLQNMDDVLQILGDTCTTVRFIKQRPIGIIPIKQKDGFHSLPPILTFDQQQYLDQRPVPISNQQDQVLGEVNKHKNTESDSSESCVKCLDCCVCSFGRRRQYSTKELQRMGSKNSRESSENSFKASDSPSHDLSININLVNVNHTPSPTEGKLPFVQIARTADGDIDTANNFDSEMYATFPSVVQTELSKILSSNMPRLPHLRLIIVGRESSNFAQSFFPGRVHPISRSEVCSRYCTYLIQKDNECKWLPLVRGEEITQPIVKAVCQNLPAEFANTRPAHYNCQHSALLHRICQDAATVEKNSDQIQLEILAMSESQDGQYCKHILYTAHSIYIVQFSVDDYFQNNKSVWTRVQSELSQIRSYASDKVQIMLVCTSTNVLTPKDQDVIEHDLHMRFFVAFGKQLHYNQQSNMPCYFVYPRTTEQEAVINHNYTANLCQQPASCKDDISLQSRPNFGQMQSRDEDAGCSADCSAQIVWDMDVLTRQIDRLAFQQDFIQGIKYPYHYLICHEQIEKLRQNQRTVAQKYELMQKCGVDKEDHLLKYLHDCGEVICKDYLDYVMSQKLLNSRLPFMVLLSREYLINAARKLINIPSLANQDPASRTGWMNLSKGMISQTFLLDLLGSCANVLCVFLDLMNLIYCVDDGMNPDHYNQAPQYLVPFNFSGQLPEESIHSPLEYRGPVLYFDFFGFIPHGAFMSILLQLIGVSSETRGDSHIDSQYCGRVTFNSDCALKVQHEQLCARIKISTECKLSYHPRNIYTLLGECMKHLKPSNSNMNYMCGPACPRCQFRGDIHVLDIKDGKGPLWCNGHQIDQLEPVKQWLEANEKKDRILCHRPKELYIRETRHIRYLPQSLYKWICQSLNTRSKNWENLAGELGYRLEDIFMFRERRNSDEDPCDSLLQDWGKSSSATLKKLMETFNEMGRLDLVEVMRTEWHITK